MKIFDATDAHLSSVAQIHINAWRKTYKDVVSQQHLDTFTTEKTKIYWAGVINKQNTKVLVAENKNNILGFIYLRHESPHDYNAEIEALYIEPSKQNRGIGTQLVNHVINNISNQLCLWVLDTNVVAKKFYSKVGFSETNKTKQIELEPTKSLRVRNLILGKQNG